MIPRLLTMLLAALMIAPMTSLQSHAGLLEPHVQPKLQEFPHCDDPRVVDHIVERFNWAEEHTWHRGIHLLAVEHTRERQVHDGPYKQIPRRYCRGHALLSNGHHPTVLYLIEGGQGFAGTGFNVEFCVNGLDPWRVYNGSCRTINY